MPLTMAKVKLFDILDDMRKAFPEYADTLGKEFDDETMLVRKPGPAETIDVQPSEHIIVGRISTIAVDTYKEVVLPEGMDTSRYDKNKVVLWGHNYLDYLPHGENVWLTPYPRKKPHEVRAASKYYQDQQRGREVYSHREQRRPLGYSIGYVPLKDVIPDDGDEWKELLEKWQDRYAEYKGGDISKRNIPVPELFTTKWQLLEYSDVVVPANSDAVQIYVQKGFITESEIPEYTLDDSTNVKAATPHVSLPLMPEDAAWNPTGVPDSQIIEAILGRDPADGDWTAQMNANYKKVNCWWDGEGGKLSAFKLKIGRRDPITDKSAPLKYNWHQTANRMAILMGGRGGVDIPDADRKPVYNRLVKVYRMFDKEPPDFKEYRPEVLDAIDLLIEAQGMTLDKPIRLDILEKLEPQLYLWSDTIEALSGYRPDIRPPVGKLAELQAQIDDIYEKLNSFIKTPEFEGINTEDVKRALSQEFAKTFEKVGTPKPPEQDAISDLNISDFLEARRKGKLI